MKNPIFTGSGVAIVTPFDKDDNVNYNKLAELIEFQIENKTDAIIICGTTGESSTLSDEEHEVCIKFAVEIVKGRVPVIAGTGSNDTAYARELSVHARSVNADGLLIVSPYYNKTTQAGLVKHFSIIANEAKLPTILYNVPSRTGMNIAPETCLELSKNPYIYGVKEASSNISQIAQVAAICNENELYLYSGNDDQITPVLALGGIGVISVIANILPKETHNICEYFFNGEIDKSIKLQLDLLEFINNIFIEVNPTPVKAAMNMLGYDVGHCRMPLVELSDKNLASLKACITKLGLLK